MSESPLLEKYLSDLQGTGSQADPAQASALERFQLIYDQLNDGSHRLGRTFLGRILKRKQEHLQGLYIWGGVGRGKTYLMDLFYEAVPETEKKRIHFHRFMQSVHGSLKTMRNLQNPLEKIGKDFARQYRLLCLDEFFVLDIGDAVILSGLLKSLTDNGVIIVMTSNTAPDDLYLGGIQRDRFVPAIKLINERMDVHKIADGPDFRLMVLSGKTLFYPELGTETDQSLIDDFERFSGNDEKQSGNLDILGRQINTIGYTEHLVWFDFSDICDGPRSKADYIEIANLYRTVMISNIPLLTWEYENQARRFIELIDEFYDRGVHLIASAEAAINELYCGKRLVREYERTSSRLHEMQTERYLSRTHCG